MDIYEQIERFDRLLSFVENELPKYAEQVLAVEIANAVSDRVINTGKNYKGGSFKPYSTNLTAAYRFWGLSRTNTAEKKIRKLARDKGALSYKGFRELNNLKTDNKIFEFTGTMWREFGVVKSTKTASGFTIKIGGTKPKSQQKIDENSKREGISIVEASEKEEFEAQQATQAWLENEALRILTDE